MAATEPVPEHLQRTARAWARYKRLMSWMVLVAVVTVIAALAWLKASGAPLPLHMVIATIAGVGFTVLLGTALMGLVYFSNASGHDEEAHLGDFRSGADEGTDRDDA